VQIEREVESLRAALEFLYDHPDERIAIGERARDWSERAFNPKNYAERLLEVCRLASGAQAQIQAGQFFAEILEGWGATPDSMHVSGALAWIGFNHPGVAASNLDGRQPDRNGEVAGEGSRGQKDQDMVTAWRQADH
jgi:hypothetical protein